MLKDILFPKVCGFCGTKTTSGYICGNCKSNIKYNGLSYIPFDQNMFFDELYCNYVYEGIVRKKILDFKFEHKKYLCKTFAEGMTHRFEKIKPNFELIVSVPIHKSRKKERGYNQSELIAKILSKTIGIEYSNKCLIKVKKNLTQSKLDKNQRQKNVKNVFQIKDSFIVRDKTILLIDDIYTTGSTVNECARVLKKDGAKKVIVYTIAKATINSHVE